MTTKAATSFLCEQDRIRDIQIRLVWHGGGSRDWSVAIDGDWNTHISADVIEAIVEYKLIVAETSLRTYQYSEPIPLAK